MDCKFYNSCRPHGLFQEKIKRKREGTSYKNVFLCSTIVSTQMFNWLSFFHINNNTLRPVDKKVGRNNHVFDINFIYNHAAFILQLFIKQTHETKLKRLVIKQNLSML